MTEANLVLSIAALDAAAQDPSQDVTQDVTQDLTNTATGVPDGGAAGGPPEDPKGKVSFLTMFGPWLLIFFIFWLLVIAPQGKERKRRAGMLKALKKEDNVMTTGGLYGRVAKVEGEAVTLVVADNVRMRFHRQSIQTILEDSRESDEAPTQSKR